MRIAINLADNGFIIDVEEPQNEHCYFIAIDIDDVVSIVADLLAEATANTFDMSDLAYNQVPNDKS